MECGKNGFTLVECLTCLAVISVLASFSYPSFSTLQDRMLFRSELTNLVTSIQQAKMAAIRSNSFVVLQTKENGYTVFEDNGAGVGVAGDWIRQGTERILIDCVLPTDIALITNFKRIRFRGTPGMKGGTLTLRSAACGKDAKVVINAVGRIRVTTLTWKKHCELRRYC